MMRLPPLRFATAALLGALASTAVPASLLVPALPAMAQVGDANVRAVNVARTWAINTNGGLSVYVPAACMFATGAGGGPCLVNSTPEGFFFRFVGGTPGWQEEGRPPNRETALQVSADGRTVVNVSYNGPPR